LYVFFFCLFLVVFALHFFHVSNCHG
jgi:hypothetical protein